MRPASRSRSTAAPCPTMNAHALPLAQPLMTADQVAALLAVPRSSVYEYARRQHEPLPSLRVGRHLRFHRADIERWLAEQRV